MFCCHWEPGGTYCNGFPAQHLIWPHENVPIQDCGEPLVPIPLEQFAVVDPVDEMATQGGETPEIVTDHMWLAEAPMLDQSSQ